MSKIDKKALKNFKTYAKQLQVGISQSYAEKMSSLVVIDYENQKIKLCERRIEIEEKILAEIQEQIKKVSKRK